jgi:hypothetical protein
MTASLSKNWQSLKTGLPHPLFMVVVFYSSHARANILMHRTTIKFKEIII